MSGRLYVISGPAGAGKGTLVARLLQACAGVRVAVSATTRPPRVGEQEGVAYYFLSAETFEGYITQGRLVEWANVHGNYYGTPVSEVERLFANGYDVLLEIDVQGYEQVKAKMPEAYGIFIAPPSLVVLEERLRGRATDSEEQIQTRLRNARLELALKDRYNAVIVNDDLDAATRELIDLVQKGSACP
jgi:guanylate kinase